MALVLDEARLIVFPEEEQTVIVSATVSEPSREGNNAQVIHPSDEAIKKAIKETNPATPILFEMKRVIPRDGGGTYEISWKMNFGQVIPTCTDVTCSCGTPDCTHIYPHGPEYAMNRYIICDSAAFNRQFNDRCFQVRSGTQECVNDAVSTATHRTAAAARRCSEACGELFTSNDEVQTLLQILNARMKSTSLQKLWFTSPATRALALAPFSKVAYTEDEFLEELRTRDEADMTSPTNGYLTQEISGQGFGVELEYVGNVSRDVMAQALHDAGVSGESYPLGYHGSASNEWRDWFVEHDSSVSGEVVSPILFDNEESWAKLDLACRTIRAAGGQTGVNAGSHLSIGARSDGTYRPGLALFYTYFSGLLNRLATVGETHRGSNYCPAITPDAARYILNESDGGRYAINVSHLRQRVGRRVEFREFDSSLDMLTIKRQTALASALMKASERLSIASTLDLDLMNDDRGREATLMTLFAHSDVSELSDEQLLLKEEKLFHLLSHLPIEANQRRIIMQLAR